MSKVLCIEVTVIFHFGLFLCCIW